MPVDGRYVLSVGMHHQQAGTINRPPRAGLNTTRACLVELSGCLAICSEAQLVMQSLVAELGDHIAASAPELATSTDPLRQDRDRKIAGKRPPWDECFKDELVQGLPPPTRCLPSPPASWHAVWLPGAQKSVEYWNRQRCSWNFMELYGFLWNA